MAAATENELLDIVTDYLSDTALLPVEVLKQWWPHLTAAVGSDSADVSELTRARIYLRLLEADVAQRSISIVTHRHLKLLAEQCVGVAGLTPGSSAALPSSDLLLQIKTEVGIQTFRDTRTLLADAEAVLADLFQGDNTPQGYSRYTELMAALRSPAQANAAVEQHPFSITLAALDTFVRAARKALPVPMLRTVWTDILTGKYIPGESPAAVPPASRAAATSPMPPPRQQAAAAAAAATAGGHRAGYPQAPAVHPPPAYGGGGRDDYEDSRLPDMGGGGYGDDDDDSLGVGGGSYGGAQRGGGGGGLEVRQLTAAVDEMHRRGGKDPLPAVLKGASRAQLQAGKGSSAAAATAAAAANGGRTKQWGDSPAVRHPAPRLGRVDVPEVTPLMGRATTTNNQPPAQGEGDDSLLADMSRRKRTRWTDAEEAELLRLVKLYGRGTWATILEKGNDVFEGRRSQVDLKDKWRNLAKANRILPSDLQAIEDQEQHLRKERMTKMPPGRPPRFVPPGGAKQARTGGGSTVKKSTGKGKKSAKKAQAEEEETEGELEHEDEDDTVEESEEEEEEEEGGGGGSDDEEEEDERGAATAATASGKGKRKRGTQPPPRRTTRHSKK